LVEEYVSVDDWLGLIVLGESETEQVGGWYTVSVAPHEPEPAAFDTEPEYVVDVDGATLVEPEPETYPMLEM
jgi:hypothetical protein